MSSSSFLAPLILSLAVSALALLAPAVLAAPDGTGQAAKAQAPKAQTSSDYIERHGDWWLQCDTSRGQSRCAARTAPKQGVSFYAVQRDGKPYLVVQSGGRYFFERREPVTVRPESGERFLTLPQQNELAYFSGKPASDLALQLAASKHAEIIYRDRFGTMRRQSFSLAGFGESYAALTRASEIERQSALPPGKAGAAGTPSAGSHAGTENSDGDGDIEQVGRWLRGVGDWLGRQISP